jgi:hypothetical protein
MSDTTTTVELDGVSATFHRATVLDRAKTKVLAARLAPVIQILSASLQIDKAVLNIALYEYAEISALGTNAVGVTLLTTALDNDALVEACRAYLSDVNPKFIQQCTAAVNMLNATWGVVDEQAKKKTPSES